MILKFLLLGDSAIGKTKLVHRLQANGGADLTQSSSTTIEKVDVEGDALATILREVVDSKDKAITKIEVHVMPGQERFQADEVLSGEAKRFAREEAHVILIGFDLMRKNTYKSVDHWHQDFLTNNRCSAQLLLFGNKTDVVDEKMKSHKFELGKKLNGWKEEVFLTSAFDGYGVTALFAAAVAAALKSSSSPTAGGSGTSLIPPSDAQISSWVSAMGEWLPESELGLDLQSQMITQIYTRTAKGDPVIAEIIVMTNFASLLQVHSPLVALPGFYFKDQAACDKFKKVFSESLYPKWHEARWDGVAVPLLRPFREKHPHQSDNMSISELVQSL